MKVSVCLLLLLAVSDLASALQQHPGHQSEFHTALTRKPTMHKTKVQTKLHKWLKWGAKLETELNGELNKDEVQLMDKALRALSKEDHIGTPAMPDADGNADDDDDASANKKTSAPSNAVDEQPENWNDELELKFSKMEKMRKKVEKKWWPRIGYKVPKKISETAKQHHQKAFKEKLEAIPVHLLGGCRRKVRASSLGLKDEALKQFWNERFAPSSEKKKEEESEPKVAKKDAGKLAPLAGSKSPNAKKNQTSLLQTGQEPDAYELHPGSKSRAQPGSGSVQQMAHPAGSSTLTPGMVNGEELHLTVLKDGFFEVGCFQDGMQQFADKYGTNKGHYASEATNVSIARYDQLVYPEDQQPMTAMVCYQFCRTVPEMSFFGLKDGRSCYCAPYYTSLAGDASKCDIPCEGDQGTTCGGAKKSQIFEMHLCADTAQDLDDATAKATEALEYYYQMAVLAGDLGNKLTKSGAALESLGMFDGDAAASDLGMAAKVWGGDLGKQYQTAFDAYTELKAARTEAIDLVQNAGDFTNHGDMVKADALIAKQKELATEVLAAGASLYDGVKQSWPKVDAALEAASEGEEAAAPAADVQGTGISLSTYVNFAYSQDKGFPRGMATCGGAMLSKPAVGLSGEECAQACDDTVFPSSCNAFNYYSFQQSAAMGFDEKLPSLCFLFGSVDRLTTYTCPETAVEEAAAALIAKKALRGKKVNQTAQRFFPKSAGCPLQDNNEAWLSFPLDKTNTWGEPYGSGTPGNTFETGSLVKDAAGFNAACAGAAKYQNCNLRSCDHVGYLVWSSAQEGMSAADTLGCEWDLYSSCPKKAESASVGGTCMVKLASIATSSPQVDWTKAERCLGGDKNEMVSAADSFEQYAVPDVSEMELQGGDTITGPEA